MLKKWVILPEKKQGQIARSAQVPVGTSVVSSLDHYNVRKFGRNVGGASRLRGNGEERGEGNGSGSSGVGGGALSSRERGVAAGGNEVMVEVNR